MSEGWVNWPLLGEGWKRKTVVRKSGQSCGLIDTYYQSPTGKRFRSKPELAKFLGESIDLSCFNFKHGTLIPPEKRTKIPKKKKSASSSSPAKAKKKTFPLQSSDEHQQNGNEDNSKTVCCTGCKVWFSGVLFGRSKQTVWYCADCRASRRTLSKEKKLLKSIGCGKCAACSLTENCGYCSICVLRIQNPEFGSSWKCVKRRCLKAIQKKSDSKLSVTKGFASKKLKTKWRLMSERDGSSLAAKNKKKSHKNKVKGKTERKKPKNLGRRKNRRCGTCEPCQRKLDCGDCDFCQDKPKFGGRNLKRQKCRWRQCLLFAVEKNIPMNLKSSKHAAILERFQREKLAAEEQEIEPKKETLQPKLDVKLTPKLPIIKLERLDYRNGGFTVTNDGGGWIIGNVETKPIKEECKENVEVVPEIQEEPLDLHCPVKAEEFIVETDDVEEADESTPVITQIFSFGSLDARNGLDPVLQEILTDLKEIPLPAYWEVLSNIGPTLQLVQRSKSSTMSDTVVHIEPGLHFNVVVREYTVPSFHELYKTHQSPLANVDEVVELICDLEAYRPCAGLPTQGPRSPNCQVLVYEGFCQECSLKPWPSGFVR